METLKAKLFRLLKDEIHNLSLGHRYNRQRLKEMRAICRLFALCEYVDVDNSDIIKIIRFYEHN